MTFRNLTNAEETILKRSFNNWGIFEIFGTLRILIRTLTLDTAISDQKTNISKYDAIPNKILRNHSSGNSSNADGKYNDNNQGRIHALALGHSNGIEFAESEIKIKRTEAVFVHSNVKYNDMLFKKLIPISIGMKTVLLRTRNFLQV
jgi:hypothetical protein